VLKTISAFANLVVTVTNATVYRVMDEASIRAIRVTKKNIKHNVASTGTTG
jgi:hypothetical protein